MIYNDLRDFIQFLEEKGELQHVSNAEPHLEIGGITEIAIHDRPSPALLFDNIKGHEPGLRLLTNAMTTPLQWTAAAGFEEPTRDKREAIEKQKTRSDVSEYHSPKQVDDGPVKENIIRDEDIDVTAFPAPHWNEKDGGEYIGTADCVFTRDPDTNRVNVGTYRVQVHSPTEVTVYISPGKDGRLIRRKYLNSGEPCPVVISLGHPPDLFFGSNERIPNHVSELDYIGGRRGESVEVVKGEVTDLPIPTTSELVLEGHIYPDTPTVTEGPFGEWTGYYAGSEHEEIPLTIERIYHRNNPINLGTIHVRPPAQVYMETRHAARLWDELDESGIPGINAVNSFPFGPQGWFTAISLSQQYPGHATQVGRYASSGPAGAYHGRFFVVVDEDIDVYDQDQVLWAMVSRCDPQRDIHIMENSWSTTLDPTIPPEKRERNDLTNSRAVIDATRPYHWKDEFAPVNEMSSKLKEQILDKWGETLFPDIVKN